MNQRNEKFQKELEQLIKNGNDLLNAIQSECYPAETRRAFEERLGVEHARLSIDQLPNFEQEYQAWYSEALATIKQVLPDRLKDFKSYYEYPRERKEISFQNYTIRDYLQGLHILDHYETKTLVEPSAAIPEFKQQLSIVHAVSSVLDSSLVDLTSSLQADLFDSEVDSAQELKKVGFLRAAGAICGVVLEKHLKQVCANRNIVVRKKNPTLSYLNDLLKDKKAISLPEWRELQLLSDIRNICCHDKNQEPTLDQLDELLDGTNKVLKKVN